MEKYLAALLLCVASVGQAQVVKGTIPIICATAQEFSSTIVDYKEEALLAGVSLRDTGQSDGLTPFAMVIFTNPDTGTFTIAEKVADMYCVIAIGKDMQPYPRDGAAGKKTGL